MIARAAALGLALALASVVPAAAKPVAIPTTPARPAPSAAAQFAGTTQPMLAKGQPRLAVHFADADAARAELTALWGAPTLDGKAALWWNPGARVRAHLDGGDLLIVPYLPIDALFAAKGELLGAGTAALRAKGTLERDRPEDRFGLGYSLAGPALPWQGAYIDNSVYLFELKKGKVARFYVDARIVDHPWHEDLLAAAEARLGPPVATAKRADTPEDVEDVTFRRGKVEVRLSLLRRGGKVTFVEVRARLR